MSDSIAVPFALGRTYWKPNHASTRVDVVCPCCAGKREVTVILGDGEHVAVDCEGCGIGFGRPQGTITEYQSTPGAAPVTVVGVASMHGDEWHVLTDTGQTEAFNALYLTEAEATCASMRLIADMHERNMQTRQRKRRASDKSGWTVRYHREQIKDLERQLTWHREKVRPVTA